MDGIIIVNKPQGWTSFDVVAKIRSLTRVSKVGHSGTLDPMATGVLPVFLGRATKSIQYFLNGDKGYEGEMTLGVRTDTGDADGKVIPDIRLTGYPDIRDEDIRKIFQRFTGEITQVPPMYSAVKVNGQRLYKLARKGIEVKRQPRKVRIYDLRLVDSPHPPALNTPPSPRGRGIETNNLTQQPYRHPNPNPISFSVLCSKGTYIRQLAVDIGDELGCGAHLSKLIRTYAHPFRISQAIDMDVIVTMVKAGTLASAVIQPEEILNESK